MAVRELTEEERIRPAVRELAPAERIQVPAAGTTLGVTPRAPLSQPRGVMGTVSEAARQFNIGAMEPFGLGSIPAQGAGTERPETGGMGAARMIGNAAGTTAAMLVPATRLANTARFTPWGNQVLPGARETGKRILTEIGESALQNPGKFWSLEILGAGGAGALGAEVASETDSPTAILAAELLGGAGVTAVAPTVGLYAKASPLVTLAQSTWRAFRDRGEALGVNRIRAGTRIREAEPSPRAALQRANEADVLPGANLTLAELAESPGLLALQRSIADSSDQLSAANQQRFADINKLAQDQLTSLGDGPDGPVDVNATRLFLQDLIEERVRVARVAVDERLETLGPNADNATSSNLARRELTAAEDAAAAQEDELWGAIPRDLVAPIASSMNAYSGLLREESSNRVLQAMNLMPPIVKRMLGTYGIEDGKRTFQPGTFVENPPTVRELYDMRKELVRFAREERAKDAPNNEAIRVAAIMQDAILNDLARVPDANDQLKIARAFSADKAARFQQGEVGTILGYERTGEGSVPETLTLERILGLSGPRGRVATNQLLEAVQRTGNTDAMRGHMQDWLRYEFSNSTMNRGEFDPIKAQNYLNRRREVLKIFPELRRDMERAMLSGEEFRVTSNMKSPDLAAAALVTARAPGAEWDRVLQSSNPAQSARELRGILETDPDGRALAGMRGAVMGSILDRSLQLNAVDVTDVPYASGRKLFDQLENPAVMGALEELFDPTQIDMMKTVAETLRKAEISRSATPSREGIINDKEALLLGFLRRIGASAIGSRVTRATGATGNLVIPSAVVRATDELRKRGLDPAREFLIDIMTNPNQQQMRTMMLSQADLADNAVRQQYVGRQLNAWAAAVAAKYGMSLSEEEAAYQPGSSFDPGDLPVVRQ